MIQQKCFACRFMLIPNAVEFRWMQDLSDVVKNNSNSDNLCLKWNPKIGKLSKDKLSGLSHELYVSEEARWRIETYEQSAGFGCRGRVQRATVARRTVVV